MSLVSTLYHRFRMLIHEGAKFLVIGGIGFVVTEVGFNLFHFSMGLGLFTSTALATLAATIVTFAGNRYWTFRHRQGHGTTRESVMFVALNGVGLLIQYSCVWFAQNVLGFSHTDKFSTNVAFLFGVLLGTVFRFWSYRKWVWHAQSGGPGQAVSAFPSGGGPGGLEAREPVLVPPEPAREPAPGWGGAGRPGGPRHSRSE